MLISSHRNQLLTIALSLFLVFAGCNSSTTDSNSDDNNSGNQNQYASFQSGTIGPGESFSYIFEEEEVVEYYCTIHTPDMQGEVTVTSNATPVERDTVSMENNQFNPSNLEVAPNTEVVWINNEGHDHNIRTGNPSSDDGGSNPSY